MTDITGKREGDTAASIPTDAPRAAIPAATIDPLLECLVFLSSHYGRAKSADAIRAGLAYDEKGMGPALFCEAAERLSLKSQILKKPALSGIPSPVLPAVLIMQGNQACVLMSVHGGSAKIYSPETKALRDTTIADLNKSYAGYAIYVHPRASFTDHEARMAEHEESHWFWGLAKDNAGIYGRVITAGLLINLFGLVGPLFIMNVYDRVIPNSAIETGWVLGTGALAVYCFDLVIRTLRGYFIDIAGRRIDIVASRRIYDQLLDMKLAGRPPSSGAFANMLREFDSVRDFVTSATMTALVDLPFSILFLTVIYLIAGPLGLILFFLILTVIGIGLVLQFPLKMKVARTVRAAETRHGILVETINGLETIKAIGAEGRLRAKYGAQLSEAAELAQSSRMLSGLGVNIATFLQQSASIILVLLGMYLVRDSHLTMGALIACVMLGSRAISPIGQIANLVARYHQARNSLRTLNRIMALPVERPVSKQFLHRPDLKGKITFEKVSFSYPGGQKVLDNINFVIQPGEKVGIVGRIGSGKSTMARLILGLYEPQEGAILADDTDYRQIDPADLRRNIAYIAQDIVLFRGSIRENIAISKPQATEEEILEAAREAGVHDFVSRHPMGYDAPVGERGEGLSGGQRQTIALARAMLLAPNIMICDEPTNAMDMQAEEIFTRQIESQIRGRTFVMITHRPHLLKLVDRLILLDRGKVIADGPRDKVLEALTRGAVQVKE